MVGNGRSILHASSGNQLVISKSFFWGGLVMSKVYWESTWFNLIGLLIVAGIVCLFAKCSPENRQITRCRELKGVWLVSEETCVKRINVGE